MKFFFTYDIEDWYHTANFTELIKRDIWSDQHQRVEVNTRKILSYMTAKGNKGTFFVLGWVAKKYKDLVREIAEEGHEIASHGTHHEIVYNLSQDEFRQDIRDSKKILEDITGEEVLGYRAPNFSITDWAIEILMEEGFTYDSSVFKTLFHDRYGKLTQYESESRECYKLKPGFYEFPLTNIPVGQKYFPWAGGAYFRFMPYWIYKLGLGHMKNKCEVFNFYLHPWELDDSIHYKDHLSGFNRIRQSYNLKACDQKLEKLTAGYQSVRMKDYLNENFLKVE